MSRGSWTVLKELRGCHLLRNQPVSTVSVQVRLGLDPEPLDYQALSLGAVGLLQHLLHLLTSLRELLLVFIVGIFRYVSVHGCRSCIILLDLLPHSHSPECPRMGRIHSPRQDSIRPCFPL